MIKIIGLILVALVSACQYQIHANEYTGAAVACVDHNGVSHLVVGSGWTTVVCIDGMIVNNIGYKK